MPASCAIISQGNIEQTGAPFDVAINGKGYFAVQTPQGSATPATAISRLDASGQIVTSDGYPVQGDGGAITITPDDGDVHIGADGTISSVVNGVGNQIGKLQVVDFADDRALIKQGASLYSTTQTPDTRRRRQRAPGHAGKLQRPAGDRDQPHDRSDARL